MYYLTLNSVDVHKSAVFWRIFMRCVNWLFNWIFVKMFEKEKRPLYINRQYNGKPTSVMCPIKNSANKSPTQKNTTLAIDIPSSLTIKLGENFNFCEAPKDLYKIFPFFVEFCAGVMQNSVLYHNGLFWDFFTSFDDLSGKYCHFQRDFRFISLDPAIYFGGVVGGGGCICWVSVLSYWKGGGGWYMAIRLGTRQGKRNNRSQ